MSSSLASADFRLLVRLGDVSQFVRFQAARTSPHTGMPQGLFAAYWLLKQGGELSDQDLRTGSELYDWFQEHVPNLPFYADGNPTRAITWGKSEALEVVRKARELAALVASYGVEIAEVMVSSPGPVVYEDEFQVAVTRK